MPWFRSRYYRSDDEGLASLREARRNRRSELAAERKAAKEKMALKVAQQKAENAKFTGNLLPGLLLAESNYKDFVKQSDTTTRQSQYTWGERWKIILNPDVMCPFCRTGVSTRQIWFLDFLPIDEYGSSIPTPKIQPRVQAVFDLKTGARLVSHGFHPHVGTGGRVCTGNTNDVIAALFNGLNPFSPYYGTGSVAKWLEKLGHNCWGELHEFVDRQFYASYADCRCVITGCCKQPRCKCKTNLVMGHATCAHVPDLFLGGLEAENAAENALEPQQPAQPTAQPQEEVY